VVAKPYTAALYHPPAPYGDHNVRVRPIRAYRQVRGYTCGFASALTVLHAFQRNIAPRELYERLGTDREGTGQSAIIRELRRGGLGVNPRYDLDFDALRRAIDQGKLIVGYHHGVEHWVVIYGYGRDPDRVFIADPVVEWRSEQLWSHYGQKLKNFGIVCSGRQRRITRAPRPEESNDAHREAPTGDPQKPG
jgi:ABC-type bacteriocin/lantibiotic exporter with double-glycine peptidase domain